MNIRQKKLPIAALERIDDLCAEFERKWQSDEPATVESVLSGDVSTIERDVLLAELHRLLTVDYRRRRGKKHRLSRNTSIDSGRFQMQSAKHLNEGEKRTGVFRAADRRPSR